MIYNDGVCQEKNNIWFIGYEDNILYHMDIDLSLSIVTELPSYIENVSRVYSKCLKKGDYIYCFPNKGDKLIVYNLVKDERSNICIKEIEGGELTVINAWIIDNNLWCLANGTKELYRINLERFCVENRYKLWSDKDICGYEAIEIDGNIYTISKTSNEIKVFDTKTERISKIETGCYDEGFNTILYDDEKLYLTGYGDKIYSWDMRNKKSESFSLIKEKAFSFEEIENPQSTRFYLSCVLKDYLLFVPYNTESFVSDRLLFLDKKNGVIKSIDLQVPGSKRESGEQFSIQYSMGNVVCVQDDKRDCLIEVDVSKNVLKQRYIKKNTENIGEFWRKNEIRGVKKESISLGLEELIINVTENRCKDSLEMEKRNYGGTIWSYIKDTL